MSNEENKTEIVYLTSKEHSASIIFTFMCELYKQSVLNSLLKNVEVKESDSVARECS